MSRGLLQRVSSRVITWLRAIRHTAFNELRLNSVEHAVRDLVERTTRLEIHTGVTPIETPAIYMAASEWGAATEGATIEQAESGELYVAFENLFYPHEMVLEYQKEYVPYILRHTTEIGGGRVVDVGCGRGEFLGLLRDQGVTAEGVEMNEAEVAILRDAGYQVHHTDVNSFLRESPEGSIDVLVALEVVEHMSADYFLEFVRLVGSKLSERAMLIIETPNIRCAEVQSSFYYDMTHVRPYPVEMVRFFAASAGFTTSNTLYLGPAPQHARRTQPEFNYMSYGLIACRSAVGAL